MLSTASAGNRGFPTEVGSSRHGPGSARRVYNQADGSHSGSPARGSCRVHAGHALRVAGIRVYHDGGCRGCDAAG